MVDRLNTLKVVDRWFAVEPFDHRVTLITEPYVDRFLRSNIWHVRGRDRDLVVDSGNGIGSLRRNVPMIFERPVLAVGTHAHSDHMGGLHEFEHRLAHPLEADDLANAADAAILVTSQFDDDFIKQMRALGYHLPDVLVSAAPSAGFDASSFVMAPSPPTSLVEEGDVIDLGDRVFTVLHLPGHSPGLIGLWEKHTGTLFASDAVLRDQPILDAIPGADAALLAQTLMRLRELPVSIVHAGHDPSFGRDRLAALIDRYLSRATGASASVG